MKSMNSLALVVGLFLVPCVLSAQAPAGAPAGTSGKCKDGTFTSAATKQGACRGHQGVDTWYAAAATSAPAAAAKSAPAPKAAAAPAANSAAGATGKCKDGTFTSAATKQGACRGHQGVDTWFATAAPAATPAPVAAPTPVPAPAPRYTPPPVAAPAQAPAPARASTSDKTPAPGGGPGMVWVNSASNVYHCYGSQWYGTTKAGKYMSESQATASGARADHGKPCSK